MYCILFDEESKSVAFYRDKECFFALNQHDYYIANRENISYFSMLDMAMQKMKQRISFDIIDLKRDEDFNYMEYLRNENKKQIKK